MTHFSHEDHNMRFHYTLEDQPDPALFRMHMHDECEIYCFLQGKGTYNIEGSIYPLKRGDILLMRPAESHYPQLDASVCYERISVHFRKDLFDMLDPTGRLLQPFYDRGVGKRNLYRADQFTTSTYQHLIGNFMIEEQINSLSITANLMALLNELQQAFEHRNPLGAGDSLPHQIVHYINHHLAEPLSLDRICGHFFISKPHLCRIFKQATGSSVAEYINAKRLAHARELIALGTLPTKAALQCGFNDYSVFYRNFRKLYHLSPTGIAVND